MGSVARWPFDEEFRIELDAAFRLGVELHHPTVYTLGIYLSIDCAIERIRKIDASTIAADLDHLWAAIKTAIPCARMVSSRYNATNAHFARKLRLERIGDVVLLQVARTPTGQI